MVVDLDPQLKRGLYAALAADGTTFKDWLLVHIDDYLANRRQPPLPGFSSAPDLAVAEDAEPYYNHTESKKK